MAEEQQKQIDQVTNQSRYNEYNSKLYFNKHLLSGISSFITINQSHNHPGSYLSAAYYVKAPENCGKFMVENPNSVKKHFFPQIANKTELNMPVASIDVSEGDLLIFPGYLPHKVGKNESDEDRIVISFNVNIA